MNNETKTTSATDTATLIYCSPAAASVFEPEPAAAAEPEHPRRFIARENPDGAAVSDWRDFCDLDECRLWGISNGSTAAWYSCFRHIDVGTDFLHACEKVVNEWPGEPGEVDRWISGAVALCFCEAENQMKRLGHQDRSVPEWPEAEAAMRRLHDALRAGWCEESALNLSEMSGWAEALVKVATVLSGIIYAVREIHGNGDTAWLFIPKCELGARAEIEARYFNTGTAWTVETEEGEFVCEAYTWDREPKRVRARIREQAELQAFPISDGELTVMEIDRYDAIPVYKVA